MTSQKLIKSQAYGSQILFFRYALSLNSKFLTGSMLGQMNFTLLKLCDIDGDQVKSICPILHYDE